MQQRSFLVIILLAFLVILSLLLRALSFLNLFRIVFHNPIVSFVQEPCSIRQLGVSIFVERIEQLPSHAFSAFPRPDPRSIEIAGGTIILRHRHRVGNVQNRMPPTVGNIDCFSGILREFETAKVFVFWNALEHACFPLDAGKDEREIVDCLVVFVTSNESGSFHDALWYMGREEHPSFLSYNQRVPSTCCQWVDVNTSPTALWSHQPPSIGWSKRIEMKCQKGSAILDAAKNK